MDPCAAWIDDGTLTCVLLEASCILMPPAGAAADSVIWQTLVPPPVSVCGLQDREVTEEFGFDPATSESATEAFWPTAERYTVVLAETEVAVAVNVVLVKPAPMVIDGGIVTLVLEELSVTVVLACAALPRLKVHVLTPGVWMVAGAQIKLAGLAAGVMVSAIVRMTEPAAAEIVAPPLEALAATVAVTLADVEPAGIMTEPGTLTCELLLDKVTEIPPAGAAAVREMAQVLEPPAATVAGAQAMDARADCGATVSV